MNARLILTCSVLAVSLLVAHAVVSEPVPTVSPDPADWPMYNHDVLGYRFNPAEKTLTKDTASQIVEQWRFPAADAKETIGVVHGTPVVLNGEVYFGTATQPTFYKLDASGKLKWSYKNPDKTNQPKTLLKPVFGLPSDGFITSCLVAGNTVYFGDIGGFVFALDAETGKERWKVNTRVAPFPGAHGSNCVFTGPILAEGLLIVAGGGFEHILGLDPKHECCSGRGWVTAFDPNTGEVKWKYDVGPEPQKFDPPLKLKTAWGERTFHYGPSTSSVWCVPSYDAASHTLFFGTDAHNSPRQPTADNPKYYTEFSCAVIAIDSRNGQQKWVNQVNPDDVWNYSMRAYDPKTGLYKDQSIGDTPKIFTIDVNGTPTKAVGCGCKNGGFYVLDAATGKTLAESPRYRGKPDYPLDPPPHPRMLALPSAIGGIQTGCACDGRAIYTNGIDHISKGTGGKPAGGGKPAPTGGRVVASSLDLKDEYWRHERPKVAAVGGTTEKPAFKDVGDPVGSGIALAGGVAWFTTTVSNKLVALDMATGKVLKEVDLGPVWCGPSVSRGRVYVGTGNTLFAPGDPNEAYFPKKYTGAVICFGLPGGE